MYELIFHSSERILTLSIREKDTVHGQSTLHPRFKREDKGTFKRVHSNRLVNRLCSRIYNMY